MAFAALLNLFPPCYVPPLQAQVSFCVRRISQGEGHSTRWKYIENFGLPSALSMRPETGEAIYKEDSPLPGKVC